MRLHQPNASQGCRASRARCPRELTPLEPSDLTRQCPKVWYLRQEPRNTADIKFTPGGLWHKYERIVRLCSCCCCLFASSDLKENIFPLSAAIQKLFLRPPVLLLVLYIIHEITLSFEYMYEEHRLPSCWGDVPGHSGPGSTRRQSRRKIRSRPSSGTVTRHYWW